MTISFSNLTQITSQRGGKDPSCLSDEYLETEEQIDRYWAGTGVFVRISTFVFAVVVLVLALALGLTQKAEAREIRSIEKVLFTGITETLNIEMIYPDGGRKKVKARVTYLCDILYNNKGSIVHDLRVDWVSDEDVFNQMRYDLFNTGGDAIVNDQNFDRGALKSAALGFFIVGIGCDYDKYSEDGYRYIMRYNFDLVYWEDRKGEVYYP